MMVVWWQAFIGKDAFCKVGLSLSLFLPLLFLPLSLPPCICSSALLTHSLSLVLQQNPKPHDLFSSCLSSLSSSLWDGEHPHNHTLITTLHHTPVTTTSNGAGTAFYKTLTHPLSPVLIVAMRLKEPKTSKIYSHVDSPSVRWASGWL